MWGGCTVYTAKLITCLIIINLSCEVKQFPFGTGEVFGHLHPVVDSLPCHRYAVLQVSISVCRASHSRTLTMLYSEVTTAVRSLICVKRVLS